MRLDQAKRLRCDQLGAPGSACTLGETRPSDTNTCSMASIIMVAIAASVKGRWGSKARRNVPIFPTDAKRSDAERF